MFGKNRSATESNYETYQEEEEQDHLEVIMELPQEVFEYSAEWHRHHRELERLLKGPEAA
jgi:hypothetical protein